MPAWQVPTDYDDSVYFASASLLVRGMLPYRDFTMVHPPGILLFHAPSALIGLVNGPAAGFVAARWLTLTLAASGALLAGRIAERAAGPVGAVVAAALYATHPEAVGQDRGPYLEPLLNVLALAAAFFWLDDRGRRPRSGVVGGALTGAACAVKFWAGVWGVAALAALPAAGRWREARRLLGSAAAVGLLVVGPFALVALGPFLEQTLWFHALRPVDGVLGLHARGRFLLVRYLGPNALMASGALVLAVRGRARDALLGDACFARTSRFFCTALAQLIVAFLVARTFWPEYCSHLAPVHAVLGGLGAQVLWDEARSWRPRLRPVAALLILAAISRAVVQTLSDSTAHQPAKVAGAEFLRAHVSPDACLLSFEPIWGLAADRIPARHGTQPPLVDAYGSLLIAALRSGVRGHDLLAMLHAPAAQAEARAYMDGCNFVTLGWHRWPLDETSLQWLAERYEQRYPPPGVEGPEIWERRRVDR